MRNTMIVNPELDTRWDAFVHNHPFGWIYHLGRWKVVLEGTFDHIRGYYLALVDQDSGAIRAALPLYHVRSWLTGNRLVSMPFATLSDPLISSGEDLEILIRAAMDLMQVSKSKFIELRTLNAYPLIQNPCFRRRDCYINHYLELTVPPQALKKRFHRSCVRQKIDRALKTDLVLKLDNDYIALQRFYRLHVLTRKRLSLVPQPFNFLESLWRAFAPSGYLQILIAEEQKRAVGGLILLKYKERVSVEFAASDYAFQGLCPNHFLFWEAIKLAYHDGYKIFDFGRTSRCNYSLMDFKRRWGTIAVPLPEFFYPDQMCKRIEDVNNSMKYKIIKKIAEVAPLSTMRIIGAFCYRHLG